MQTRKDQTSHPPRVLATTIAGVKLPRLPRRKVLKAAIAFGVLGATGSVVALVRSRGYEVPDGVRTKLVGLEAWQYVVVQHLARRVCAADEPGVVTPDEADVAGFVDGYVANMAPRMRRDLGRFLGVIEQLAPAGLAMASRSRTSRRPTRTRSWRRSSRARAICFAAASKA